MKIRIFSKWREPFSRLNKAEQVWNSKASTWRKEIWFYHFNIFKSSTCFLPRNTEHEIFSFMVHTFWLQEKISCHSPKFSFTFNGRNKTQRKGSNWFSSRGGGLKLAKQTCPELATLTSPGSVHHKVDTTSNIFQCCCSLTPRNSSF